MGKFSDNEREINIIVYYLFFNLSHILNFIQGLQIVHGSYNLAVRNETTTMFIVLNKNYFLKSCFIFFGQRRVFIFR